MERTRGIGLSEEAIEHRTRSLRAQSAETVARLISRVHYLSVRSAEQHDNSLQEMRTQPLMTLAARDRARGCEKPADRVVEARERLRADRRRPHHRDVALVGPDRRPP
jgi:hypothetical protein